MRSPTSSSQHLIQGMQLRQQQKLAMTPMMQQALKILQFSALELVDYIEQQVAENPILDEAAEEEPSPDLKDEKEQLFEDPPAPTSLDPDAYREVSPGDRQQDRHLSLEDWKEYFTESASTDGYDPGETDESKFEERAVTVLPTLQEHLMWQLRLSCASEEEFNAGEVLIGNIDDQGYLKVAVPEIAATLQAPEDRVEKALALIQTFEPIGVGGRDLRETLLIQLRFRGQESSWAYRIADAYLPELERKRYSLISKRLGITPEAVREAAHWITGLEPKPGLQYGRDETKYVVPDILLEKVDDEYVFLLNEAGMPRLRINSGYRRLIQGKDPVVDQEARQYLEHKLQSALWLIRSIEQRRKTIYRVSETIVRIQRDFFEYGISSLKPLTLRRIAEEIQMHESTVSRVTTQKYIQTPRGVFELKFFFSSGIDNVSGESTSSLSVKESIKEIIENESRVHPISDQGITDILKSRGFQISRRTVTKYREEIRVLSMHQRRQT